MKLQLIKKLCLSAAMVGILATGISVFSAPPKIAPAALASCPYGPGIVVGRNYLENGEIVGFWKCDCNGSGLVWGRVTATYTQFPMGFCRI